MQLLIFSVLFSAATLKAGTHKVPAFTTNNIVRAIVGEASGCDYEVKRGVASAIYNRKTLRGVYGYHAAHVKSEPDWVWRDARKAAQEGKLQDYVGGASFFGNKSDVDKGTFDGLTFVCVLGKGKGKTYFFK